MLHINDVTFRIGGRTLLEGASFTLQEGAKCGLVGHNGTGKSTLFGLINGGLASETGTVTVRKNARIGQVAQEAPGTQQSLMEFVLDADKERKSLLAEADTATDASRIAEIQMRLVDIEAHSAEARAGSILNGLGFNAQAQQRTCASFSGGWRMRVALAAVLFAQPDLLLLDEPTNYLDLEGTLWLENYIARYPYTVFLISHDRDMLNNTTTSIVHLDQGKLTSYKGNYDQFDRQRREKQSLQLKLRAKQEDHRKHMEAFVERFRAKASKAKQAQSRLKALQKLEPLAAIVDEAIKPFHFPAPKKQLAPPILAFDNASTGYEEGKPILKGINLSIGPDDRIGLLGANGNGKSTLAKLISGHLPLMTGKENRSEKMKIAYFAQHQMDELNEEHSAYEHIRAIMPDKSESQVRARVAQLGFPAFKMDTKAKDLSGGEKARLLLGLATFDGAHLFILDEPTNHLDIDSREALIHALNAYQGAVLLISHDRHLLEATADRLWLVHDSKVERYQDDLDEYRSFILAEGKADKKRQTKQAPAPQDKRQQAAAKRQQAAPLKARIATLEKKMAMIERNIAKVDEKLALPHFFTQYPDKAKEFSKIRAGLEKDLDSTENKWIEANEALEKVG